MAANITKVPLLRAVATRGYASCPPAPIGGIHDYEVKNTTLPNNLVVASAENECPISRISIVFRAGSRNETHENAGVTHTLRICAGLSTKNATQFAITRNIQQAGATLTATSDREIVSYTLEGTRKAVEKTLPFLTEVATQQVFKPWEVSENVGRQRLELAIRPPQLRAIDLVHKAAFRRGLGNSLYSAKYNLGNISSETLQHYVASNFLSGRAAVVGLGVDHSQLVKYAQGLALESGEGTSNPSPYFGGEIRSDKGGDFAYVAIAGQGAPWKNSKEALAVSVLQKALGGGPKVKWGSVDNGALSKVVGGEGDAKYALNTFNASYSDAGIFGVLIAAPEATAGKIVQAAFKLLKAGNLTDADVNRGKNQLKAALLIKNESGSSAIDFLGSQAAVLGSAKSPSQVVAEIDSITTADVNAALKKVASGKLSIASVGQLRTVPFLDELK
ncbi:cytochrome b-c1 complex subunit 2, mitochondrial [Tribolium castaneum]|uniref:Cytochrome b-c1 complex subunit 2, mitochondrial-like Protein n=1 Tax=Tribolium castaneum TaxID=7070 RepID=D6WF14_TRICA|nr:PREDICTED: cytochrome b-c1 complex subunit 2, mitochondrial [Tribolium castaneum]EFA00465.1 Cytochrome b-c1 complex subunit 2, mitochondrial-like Protein [Tribolium castaneum]|eukprot:XP_975769.1 PREDICTED: cytochrome b-c1 complex subunit 2, mitochondrial [Tribolium castaneum]